MTKMALSEKAKEARLKEASAALPQMAIIPMGNDGDQGDAVLRKDPNTELTRIQMEMMMAYPPYEGLLLETTNFDHPMQVMSVIKDATELDLMRALGLPDTMFKFLKGESGLDEVGNIKVAQTGFNGIMRGRMGLVYPGVDGMMFHPREQIARGTRPSQGKDSKSNKSILQRIMGGGD